MRFAAKSGYEPMIGKKVEFVLAGDGTVARGTMIPPIGRGSYMRLGIKDTASESGFVRFFREEDVRWIEVQEAIEMPAPAAASGGIAAKQEAGTATATKTTTKAAERATPETPDSEEAEERDRAKAARRMRIARAKILVFILKNGPSTMSSMRDKIGVKFDMLRLAVDNSLAHELLRRDGKLLAIADEARARADVAATSGTIEAAAPIAVFAPAGGGVAFVPVAPAKSAFRPAPVDPAIVFGADPRCPACGGKAEVRAGVLRCAKCGALDDAPRGEMTTRLDPPAEDEDDEDADGGGDDDDRDGDEPDDLVDPGGGVAQAGTGAAPGGVKVGAPVPAAPIAAKPPEKNLPWALPAIPVPRNGRIVDVVE